MCIYIVHICIKYVMELVAGWTHNRHLIPTLELKNSLPSITLVGVRMASLEHIGMSEPFECKQIICERNYFKI